MELGDRQGRLLLRLLRRVAEEPAQIVHRRAALLVAGCLAQEQLVFLDRLDGERPGRFDADRRKRCPGPGIHVLRRSRQLADLDGQEPRVGIRIAGVGILHLLPVRLCHVRRSDRLVQFRRLHVRAPEADHFLFKLIRDAFFTAPRPVDDLRDASAGKIAEIDQAPGPVHGHRRRGRKRALLRTLE